ncbi:gem-associated protein 8 [Orycteropus afer afer]|uniref:Gem-associated protein 8 n=1 Tax=Orycteropus afer afer TaxID=1230840 RepID=A0AC54ZC36_ORYAF|nr:gem-associated protein 8 [Orycteropus afer afer]
MNSVSVLVRAQLGSDCDAIVLTGDGCPASFWKDGDPWYSHPVYARYWRHYRQAMAWMQSHHHAYRKAVDSYFSALWAPSPEAFPFGYGYPQSSYDHRSAPQDYHHTYPRLKGPGKRPRDSHRVHASTREQQASSEEEETDESDGEVECDLSNMEITEELRQYFAETERHREERRRQQQLDAKRLEDYVYADHDLYYNTHRSVEPPSERPGERRQAEMKRLYGASAAKIQAMEAAVQLNFNKHCDRKRPKYWPVIPLKF